MLPIHIAPCVPPAEHALRLFVGPTVEVHRFDSADVGAKTTVYSGTSDAYEDPEVPAGPSRLFVNLAIGTSLVAFQLEQLLQVRSIDVGIVLACRQRP